MKIIITSLSVLLFVGTVNAASDAEIYHGFERGNPDLSSDISSWSQSSMVVTTDKDIYHGFELGNLDLSTDSVYSPVRTASIPGIGDGNLGPVDNPATDNDIYHGFESDNPDL